MIALLLILSWVIIGVGVSVSSIVYLRKDGADVVMGDIIIGAAMGYLNLIILPFWYFFANESSFNSDFVIIKGKSK